MEEQGGEKELQTEEEEGRSVKRGDCEKNDRVRKHKKDADKQVQIYKDYLNKKGV